jgi:hypothetical protein
MSKTHLIADEKLGGVHREYVEVERNADVGDYVIYSYEGETEDTPRRVVAVEKRTVSIESYFDGINDVFGYSHRAYRTLEPTDIVRIDKEVDAEKGLRSTQRYRLVNRKADVGEKVLVVNPVVTAGRYKKGDVLTVVECQRESSDYDEGIRVNFDGFNGFFLYSTEFRVVEPVAEPAELTESDVRNNPRQVIDLIGNLALRVTELELGHSRRAIELEQQVAEVARNVETWAQEVEAVKHGQDELYQRLGHVEADLDEMPADKIKTFEFADLAGKTLQIETGYDVSDRAVVSTTIGFDKESGKRYVLDSKILAHSVLSAAERREL